MSRPLRIEFPGAVYHVTSRGDRREAIYRDDADRLAHLEVIAQAMDRFDAQALAYCLMSNHFHLVVHTRQANLSRLMRHVNGIYTQDYNRRHRVVGHLFQGRFKAILVDRDAYLLTLCRYVERNPVAAGIVVAAADWPWSSYRAHVGAAATPDWLDSDGLHGYLLGHPVAGAQDRCRAARRYAALVAKADAGDASFWQGALRGQVFLGSEAFVERMLALSAPQRVVHREIPRRQRHLPWSWQDCLEHCGGDRSLALHYAYRRCGTTMTALAQQAGLSVSHVSRLIASQEKLEQVAGGKGK
jgi:REP element-mobilizing transposase RayT/AraC-like DNA-binding protein